MTVSLRCGAMACVALVTMLASAGCSDSDNRADPSTLAVVTAVDDTGNPVLAQAGQILLVYPGSGLPPLALASGHAEAVSAFK